jgi:hypothetical protein
LPCGIKPRIKLLVGKKIRTGKNLTRIWGKSPAMVSISRAAAAAYLGRRAVAVLPPSFGWKFPRRETSHLPSNDSLPQSTLPVGGTPTLLETAHSRLKLGPTRRSALQSFAAIRPLLLSQRHCVPAGDFSVCPVTS